MTRVVLALELPERPRAAPGVRSQMPGSALSPHVTLGRFKRAKPQLALQLGRVVTTGARCCAAPFTAHQIAIHDKHLGLAGSRDKVLARYPLSR
jgi:hypothetical protein